jgi:hypothetical protein
MPSCYPNCDLRDLLLAKEDKVSRLQQVMRWCEDLYQSEPHRHHEVTEKKSVVCNMLNQTLAEAADLIYRIAQWCEICHAH